MKRIRIKEWHQDGRDYFWKLLCVVYDHEALGLLERLLAAACVEFRVEPVDDGLNEFERATDSSGQ